jgi:hypothetical protein
MKSVLVALCFAFCVSAAFGQIGSVLSNEVQPIQPISHPQHASQQSMSVERDLLIPSTPISARGERPLWEFASATPETPLGDIARMLRQERLELPKSKKVWANQ